VAWKVNVLRPGNAEGLKAVALDLAGNGDAALD
jgi:hypothetical protein